MWKADMLNGYGIVVDKQGNVYSGQFLNNQRHGEGKFKGIDNSIYVGNWEYN